MNFFVYLFDCQLICQFDLLLNSFFDYLIGSIFSRNGRECLRLAGSEGCSDRRHVR